MWEAFHFTGEMLNVKWVKVAEAFSHLTDLRKTKKESKRNTCKTSYSDLLSLVPICPSISPIWLQILFIQELLSCANSQAQFHCMMTNSKSGGPFISTVQYSTTHTSTIHGPNGPEEHWPLNPPPPQQGCSHPSASSDPICCNSGLYRFTLHRPWEWLWYFQSLRLRTWINKMTQPSDS